MRAIVPKRRHSAGRKRPIRYFAAPLLQKNRLAQTLLSFANVQAFLFLGLVLTGCGMFVTIGDVARERATTDLDCPPDHISTYGAGHGTVVARGCDAWTEYTCFVSRSGPVCIREAPAQVVRN